LDHPAGWVASGRIREGAPRQREQFALAAADIEPAQLGRIHTEPREEIAYQHPLPAMKKDRIACKPIPYRIAKQSRILGRVPIEFSVHGMISNIVR
jgi:hypothetical protein